MVFVVFIMIDLKVTFPDVISRDGSALNVKFF